MGLVVAVALLLLAACSGSTWDGERAAREYLSRGDREVTALLCGPRDDGVRCVAVVDQCLGVVMWCESETGCVALISTDVCR